MIIIIKRDDVKYRGGYEYIICKYYAILYKECQYMKFWLSERHPGTTDTQE
jgi:hypothetical protein